MHLVRVLGIGSKKIVSSGGGETVHKHPLSGLLDSI
jgi:hypothetical protein